MFRNKRGNKMTDEEKAEEYAENEQCANCSNPQYCQGKDECYDFANVKSHFLARFEAGKDMASTDLATVAYMQGAERYKPKWHKVADGDLPKENKLYLVKIKDNGLAIAYFNGQHWETRYNLGDYGHCVETVIAWCEIPTFKE